VLAARAATLKVAEAVVELIATPGRAEALGEAGRRVVRERYSARRAGADLRAADQRVLKKKVWNSRAFSSRLPKPSFPM
jgi:hypothetical protein